MDRREALAKATVTTPDVGTGLLDAERGTAFVRALKDSAVLSSQMRQEIRTASTGEVDKLSTASRIIRAATENADDGYRAGATFGQVSFTTTKVRLPWEVTEDVFHENLEREKLEATLTSEMTAQFGLDLEDLDINGDTAAGAGPDQAFLQIDDGLLKLIAANAPAGRRIDGSTINAGATTKALFFAALAALPNKYRARLSQLRWIMSANRLLDWQEYLSDRTTAAGDAVIAGDLANKPLGIGAITPASWPDSRIVLTDPKNFVRVISWQVRKRKVTGETDASLAAKDKRFYVFFVKRDVVVEEYDALVDVHSLATP